MKIAYIILAHKAPEQILRLISRLDGEGVSFFIHFDKRADDKLYHELTVQLNKPNIVFVKRYACYWGDINIVLATLDGIKTLVNSIMEFDYAILLSGQDYPIKDNQYIISFLEKNSGKEFIESFNFRHENKWSKQEGSFQPLNRVLHWHLRFRSRVFWLKLKRKYPLNYDPYGGSQWWGLSKNCIHFIYTFLYQNPDFLNYFKFVRVPDEVFFQSIISNSTFKDNVVGDNLHYVDWDNPNPPFPAILDKGYFEILKTSDKLFARKFDVTQYPDILDIIDQEFLNLPARPEKTEQ